mgnify:CR=1 FL=1
MHVDCNSTQPLLLIKVDTKNQMQQNMTLIPKYILYLSLYIIFEQNIWPIRKKNKQTTIIMFEYIVRK